MINEEAERIRLKYKYRKLILTGKLLLPYEDAARLMGPDCAYHLYSQTGRYGLSRKNPKKHAGHRTTRQTGRDPK
jgi:hypothetical protein